MSTNRPGAILTVHFKWQLFHKKSTFATVKSKPISIRRYKSSRSSYRVLHNNTRRRNPAWFIGSNSSICLLFTSIALHNIRSWSNTQFRWFTNRRTGKSFPNVDPIDTEFTNDCCAITTRRATKVEGSIVCYAQQINCHERDNIGSDLRHYNVDNPRIVYQREAWR